MVLYFSAMRSNFNERKLIKYVQQFVGSAFADGFLKNFYNFVQYINLRNS